jgi:hypothetical protein
VQRSAQWSKVIGKACRRLFLARPMPDLAVPRRNSELATNN